MSEFEMLQRSLVYVFGPWMPLFFGSMIGWSVMGSLVLMFVRLSRWFTDNRH